MKPKKKQGLIKQTLILDGLKALVLRERDATGGKKKAGGQENNFKVSNHGIHQS